MMVETLERGAGAPLRYVGRDPYQRATLLIVHGSVVLAGLDLTLPGNISATVPVALGLLPLWVGSVRRYALAPAFFGLVVVAVANGLVLSQISSVDHAVSTGDIVDELALFLSSVGAVGILLWARTQLPQARVVALFGTGALLHSLSSGTLSWKYGLALPTTLVVLGLVERHPRRALAVILVVALGVLGVLDDGRSYFGLCVLAATLSMLQARPAGSTTARSRRSRWFPALLFLGLATGLYYLASALLTGGYLGVEVQQRSIEQVETTGSLIAGGRPEWAATRELAKLHPSGYGVGVAPNWQDVVTGKRGLASINVDAGGYADNYMFGGHFRLHSVAADLWVAYGWGGLALALTVVVALVRSLSFAIAERSAPTSSCLLVALAMWFMLFGPIGSNWLEVCAAVGLVLLPRDRPGAAARAIPADQSPVTSSSS